MEREGGSLRHVLGAGPVEVPPLLHARVLSGCESVHAGVIRVILKYKVENSYEMFSWDKSEQMQCTNMKCFHMTYAEFCKRYHEVQSLIVSLAVIGA